jgi:hypothetical protein
MLITFGVDDHSHPRPTTKQMLIAPKPILMSDIFHKKAISMILKCIKTTREECVLYMHLVERYDK